MSTKMRGEQASDKRCPLSAPRWLSEQAFRQGDAPAVRRFAHAFGTRTGITSARLADFVLAVSEATACATVGGPCTAKVRLWMLGARAFCEVRGDGRLLRRTRTARQDEEETLRMLVLQQISDYVSVASRPDETRVLLSMTVA